jgi:hypothetical protein
VQFKDGGKDLSVPQPVDSAGKAQGKLRYLTVGLHQLSAEFKPTNTDAYKSSTSQLPFTVTAKPAVDTHTALAASTTGPITQGDSVTLIATVTPREASGTVQFKDGDTPLGRAVAVQDGTASEATVISNAGQRQLVAEFTPTPADPAKFNPSKSSPPLLLTVLQSPQTVTSPAQAQAPVQSLDGPTARDERGGAVVNLDLGVLTGGRGVIDLDGGNMSGDRGLTLLDVNLGGRDDRSGVTLLDGRELTVLHDRDSGGLLSSLLRALL